MLGARFPALFAHVDEDGTPRAVGTLKPEF